MIFNLGENGKQERYAIKHRDEKRSALYCTLCKRGKIDDREMVVISLKGFTKQDFNWEKYLKKCGAKAAPEHLFKQVR